MGVLRELINLIAAEKISPQATEEKKENIDIAPELETKEEIFTPDAAAEKKEVEDAAPELETRKKKEEESVEMDLSQNEVDLRKLSNLVAKEVITPDEEEKKENIETAPALKEEAREEEKFTPDAAAEKKENVETAPEQKEEAREEEKFTQVAAAEKKENVGEAPEPKTREEDITPDVAADRKEILEEALELKTRNKMAENSVETGLSQENEMVLRELIDLLDEEK